MQFPENSDLPDTDCPEQCIPIRTFGFLCLALVLLSAVLWCLNSGVHFGRLEGRFVLTAPDGAPCHVRVKAESSPVWMWRKPDNFAYQCVTTETTYRWDVWPLSGLGYPEINISFPSRECTWYDKQAIFSQELLQSILFAEGEVQADMPCPAQIEELFQLILSVGNGSAPPPRHDPYQVDGAISGVVTHRDLVTHASLRVYGAALAAVTIAGWLAICGCVKLSRMLNQQRKRTFHCHHS